MLCVFTARLLKGGGSRRVLYNFWGGSVVLLYNVIWGEGLSKMDIFCYIICGWPLMWHVATGFLFNLPCGVGIPHAEESNESRLQRALSVTLYLCYRISPIIISNISNIAVCLCASFFPHCFECNNLQPRPTKCFYGLPRLARAKAIRVRTHIFFVQAPHSKRFYTVYHCRR